MAQNSKFKLGKFIGADRYWSSRGETTVSDKIVREGKVLGYDEGSGIATIESSTGNKIKIDKTRFISASKNKAKAGEDDN